VPCRTYRFRRSHSRLPVPRIHLLMPATDLSFAPSVQELVRANHVVGRSGIARTNNAVSTTNNLIVLRNLMMELQPERTLEVGLACGGSALVFSTAHRDLGHVPDRQHIAIDPNQTNPQGYDSIGLDNLSRAGLLEYVRFEEGFSSAILPKLVDGGVTTQLAYIDGSHLFEDVFVDFYYLNLMLEEGGVVCFDDCALPDVAKVIRFIQRNFKAHLDEVDISPYRADAGRSVRYRVARLLNRAQMRAFRKTGSSRRRFKAPFSNF
jgi:cephalosporin hydroxylase